MSRTFPQNEPKRKYEHAALLVGGASVGRVFCQICFWLWGIGGLIYCFPGFGMMWSGPSVSALLYWIGGLLVFGVGGVLARSNFDFNRTIEERTDK
jgi:hypothetical protein